VNEPSTSDLLDLADWRRRVSTLYAEVRAADDPEEAWHRWRAARDRLFRDHPQSPIPEERRAGFAGIPYSPYDPEMRVLAGVEDVEPERLSVTTSRDGSFAFTRFGRVRFELLGERLSLDLLWLEGYGGGLFLSFRDGTSGSETYGAGRYLLDTVKGADLGSEDGRLVLDFNFSYQPSCSYDPRWECPLAPPANRLSVPIRAGERLPPE
jgi:uncharacterized protein